MADLTTLHGRILGQIDQLLAIAEDTGGFATAETAVSHWSPLRHAEHLARADRAALHQLESALERGGGPRPRISGRVCLGLGWIPRGVGKAPQPTRPEGIEPAAIAEELRGVRHHVEALASKLPEIANARGRASHPIFGGLTGAQWLRFLWVHHHHHLKIVRDIRKAHQEGPHLT